MSFSNNRWTALAAALAGLAVVLGAFGAHALKESLAPDRLDIFETGVKYQFYHALALLLAAQFPELRTTRWSFLTGMALFSGSLYLLACRDLLGIGSWTWLGPITPLGGTAFIIGWSIWVVKSIKQ